MPVLPLIIADLFGGTLNICFRVECTKKERNRSNKGGINSKKMGGQVYWKMTCDAVQL